MPRFTVQDDSGNTLTLEGDSPPTEQELEDIFSQFEPAAGNPGNPEAAFIPDMQATTRGGPPLQLPEGGDVMGDLAEAMPGPAALSYAGGLTRALPADLAAGMSIFKRPENQKVGLLPSASAISSAVRQNLPAAAEASGNIPEAMLNQARLPVDLQLEASANEPGGMGPAVLGHTSQGLAATAPLLGISALPSWMAKLASAGFSVHMIASAPKLFEEYANEINKPEDEQDKALIANLQSQIIQTFAFAPAAGKHGASGVAKEISTAFENASRFSQTGERKSYASQIPEAAALHGNVRAQASEAEQRGTQVPAQEGGSGIFEKAEERLLTRSEAEQKGPEAIKQIMADHGVDRDTAVAMQSRARQVHGISKEVASAPAAKTGSLTTEEQAHFKELNDKFFHGDVRPQAGEAEQSQVIPLPTEEGGARVQPEAEGRVLSPEEQNPSRTPLYRGTTLEQWNQIKSGQQPQSEFTTGGNTWATTKLESAQGYTRETGKNAVIIEYKDSAHDKVKRLTDDPGDHRRQGPLTLEDVQRVTDGDGNVIYEASKEGPAKTGRLTPEEQAHFKELNNKFFGGEEMSADEIAALDSYDARNKTAMQQRVERQAVPDEPAQAEFEAVAKKHGYNGEVAFVDEKSMADGDVLKSSWAIWNPKSGRIEVNRDAWNSLTPERRAKLIESVASEEAIHSKVSDADAADYFRNSTGIQRAIGRRIYTAGTKGLKVSENQLAHEMLRRTIQHLRGVKPTELVELAGREGWTVKSLDAVDRAINKIRQKIGTKASKAQLATLDKVQENIGIVRSALQSGAITQQPQSSLMRGDDGKKWYDSLDAKKQQDINQARKHLDNADELLERLGWSKEEASRGAEYVRSRFGSREGLSAPQRQQEPSDAAKKFLDELNKSGADFRLKNASNDPSVPTTQKLGMQLNSIADLDALLKVNNQIKSTLADVKSGKVKMTPDLFEKALRVQFPREMIETATNSGSWAEGNATGRPGGEVLGKRPLDWRSNPEVEAWLREHGSEVGIELPGQREAAAAPRRGPTKKEIQHMEELRKYKEAMGERPKQESFMRGEPAVPPEERVSASESGALPRHNAFEIEQKADQFIAGKITAKERPSFKDFREWVKNNVAQVEPHQIRDMWENAVWDQLLHAKPERLAEWREGLGLESRYGKSVIAPARAVVEKAEAERIPTATSAAEANELAKDYNHQARLRRAQDLRGIEAAQRYRNKVISAIAQKLIGESLEGRAELNRNEITVDDIDFANKKTKTGAYSVIRESDLGNPELLNKVLRDQARASSSDPESASRRLVAVVDRKTGAVELLSTYNDAGVQRVTDPAGARLTGKPSRELNKTFLRQYRPFASILLSDPVKAFRQKFESVAEFSDKIGEEASGRSRVGDFPGEAEAPEDFSVEGTPGLKGEGGMFQGPYRVPSARGGALESNAPLTTTEINGVMDQILTEVGNLNSADDVRLTLLGMADKAARGKMRAADWTAANGFRKMFNALERQDKFKDMSREEILDVLADRIYEKHNTTKDYDAFVKETLAEFEGQSPEDAGPVAQGSKFSKELTMPIDRVPPTVVRPEQLPPGTELPEPRGAPKARLGASVPGEPYIHQVSDADVKTHMAQKHALGREYQANQDWGVAFNERPKAERIAYTKAVNIRDRIYQKTGKLISHEEAMKMLNLKAGVKKAVESVWKKADRLLSEPLRSPAEPGQQGGETLAAPLRGPREVIEPDTKNPIPRFVPNVSTALTRAMGIERIPLIGRLWGERAKIRDAADQDIVGYSVKRSIGNSQSAIIGAKLAAENERLGHPFQQDKDGKLTNVNIAPGRSEFPSDVFEAWQRESIVPEKMAASRKFSDSEIAAYSERNPQTIYLNKNQEALFRQMLNVIEDGYKYLDEKNAKLDTYNGESMETRRDQLRMHGLPKGVEWYPFPRLALYKRSIGPIKTEIQRRIGGQYAVERDRLYRTEQEGQRTTAYEPDMTKRLATFVQRVYKSVADADLANSQSLKGETPEQRMTKLGKEYEAELRSGRMSQQDVIDLAYQPRLGIEGEVSHHPAFSGKIYPIEIANRLNKAFGEQSHRWVRSFAELSTASKAFMLTGDLAQYLQQGSLLMFRHPAMWANATKNSLKAIASGNVTGRILNNPENFKAATEFVQGGGSMGHLQDFMSGSQPGEMATRVPGFRQVVIRSGRAFGTFQDIAKLEMWKALRTVTPKEQWPEVIESIENMVLSGRMESAGMNHARATGERLMLMASAYYRGAFNLVAGAAEGGVAGSEARKALASYAAGITALMVGSYLLAGMSWEEIRHRLTPGQNNRKFLKFPVKMGEDTVEVGPGGIMLSLLNLGTDMATTTATDPKAMVSFGEKNPMIKWLTTRLGPIPSLGRKLATGEDAFGRPTGPFESGVQTITPIPVQKGWQAAQSANKGAGVLSAGSSFLGLDSSRYRAASEIYDLAEKFMKNSGLKKDSGWDMQANDEASYTKLRSAISAGSQRKFNQIHEKMSESRTDRDMIAAMKKWRDSPFTGSEKAEREFRSTLTDYQQDVYELAQEERARVFDAFLDMISNVP